MTKTLASQGKPFQKSLLEQAASLKVGDVLDCTHYSHTHTQAVVYQVNCVRTCDSRGPLLQVLSNPIRITTLDPVPKKG